MNIFYVYQGDTYLEERDGGYVWAPKLNKNGQKNNGYTMMTNIKKGDYIFHNCSGKVMAISIAKTDCYDSEKPAELTRVPIEWNNDGYRIDTTYYELDNPLIVTEYKNWIKEHYKKYSAFTIKGTGKQQYMCALDDEHAEYLLKKIIDLQLEESIKNILIGVLEDILEEKDSEYDKIEKDTIDVLVDIASENKKEWTGKKTKQLMTIFSATGREKPKRVPQIAADALAHANYLCEYNYNDRTFLRKNGKPYTEPHHLIPISKYCDFKYSVDTMENIVSLCSHCHNLLHYGQLEDKIPILKKLYDERLEALKIVGLELTFEQLKEYYK